MFRQRNLLARFTPKDGMHVLLRGRVSLYEPRGDYQFIADHIEEAGEGALRRRFDLLKTKLARKACSPLSASDRCPPCRDASASLLRRPELRSATCCTSCDGASARSLC